MKRLLLSVSTGICISLLGGGLVSAQTPEPSNAQDMTLTGEAPVAAGTDIVVEVLDPVTITTVECGRAKSTAKDGDQANSRFMLAVRADCVKDASGNMRVCWGPNLCQGIEFERGKAIDVGKLELRPSVAFPPDTGGADTGISESRASDIIGRLSFQLAAVAIMLSLGGLGLVVMGRRTRNTH